MFLKNTSFVCYVWKTMEIGLQEKKAMFKVYAWDARGPKVNGGPKISAIYNVLR